MSIEVSEEDGVRYLHFGTHWIQGAMRIARPWSLELDYTRDMMFPLLLQHPPAWPRRVLIVGLGAASLARFLYRYFPRAAQTVIELDPKVVNVAQQHFRLPQERARLHVEIGDGADYMMASERSFDWILVDGFDANGRAGALDTLPFYCNCLARLAPGGIVTVNLLTYRHGLRGSLARMQAAFGEHMHALPACDSGNVIALASGGAPLTGSQQALQRTAQKLRAQTRLNLAPTLARMSKA
ncbi:MAG: fused MFS/spermidine synthase [Casimicrobiaceae bacterium]